MYSSDATASPDISIAAARDVLALEHDIALHRRDAANVVVRVRYDALRALLHLLCLAAYFPRYILTFLFSNLISIFFCSLLHSLYRICPLRHLYYLRVNLAIRSEMNFRGSLNIKTLMSAPFPGILLFQRQRIYHTPRPIRAAARTNHQNSVGRTRDSIITTPAAIAVQPHILWELPLRRDDRPPRNVFSAFYAADGRFMCQLFSFPRTSAARLFRTAADRSYNGLGLSPRRDWPPSRRSPVLSNVRSH